MIRWILLACLVPGLAFAQALQVSPGNDADLSSVLDKLATRHGKPNWCEADCVTFYELRVAGNVSRGELRFELTGNVAGEIQAYVRLFGTRPAAEVSEVVLATGRRLSLLWSGDSYAVVLPPGDFRLVGALRFAANAPLTIKVPGPVGLVSFAVPDADVVGTGERRGIRDATYQLVLRETVSSAGEARKEQLRLQVERRFVLARDRTFETAVSAKGARPGQVITLPLAKGEQVEELDPMLAHVRGEGESRVLEWVAQGASPQLVYGGKWSTESIDLKAPAGAIKEIWRVRCDDPLACTFAGEAEKATGEASHVWAPLPGQSLTVTWEELLPLAGVHTVAQEVSLATHPVGRNLQQRLTVDWLSSSGSLVAVTLPAGALISRYTLDGVAAPILKDAKGAVQVSLPSGRSRFEADWEIADGARLYLAPPIPSFSEPVATLWHRVIPAEGRSVLKAGGLAGSPRVALWPNLVACLVVALVVMALSRWAKAPLSSRVLATLSLCGFGILHPLATLPLALTLGVGRFLARTARQRSKFRILLELAAWAGTVIALISVAFVTLDHALFSATPLSVDSFVSGGSHGDQSWVGEALVWGTYLSGDLGSAAHLPTPWVVMIPTFAVRLVWFCWAVVLAMYLAREGKLALEQLLIYWRAVGWNKPKADKPANVPA